MQIVLNETANLVLGSTVKCTGLMYKALSGSVGEVVDFIEESCRFRVCVEKDAGTGSMSKASALATLRKSTIRTTGTLASARFARLTSLGRKSSRRNTGRSVGRCEVGAEL